MELPGEDDIVPLDDVADHHLLLDLRPVLQLQHGPPQHRHVQRAVNPGPAGQYWFIGLLVNLHDQKDILQITVLYHVGSPVDEPPWVTAAGRLANLEVILLQKSSSPFLVDMSSPLLSNQVPPQISTWFWLISSLPEHKSQLKSLYDCLKLHLTYDLSIQTNIFYQNLDTHTSICKRACRSVQCLSSQVPV